MKEKNQTRECLERMDVEQMQYGVPMKRGCSASQTRCSHSIPCGYFDWVTSPDRVSAYR